MSKLYNTRTFAAVFGPESRGDTPEERARTSVKKWVRSMDHLGEWNEGATGLVMTSVEVLEIFGMEKLIEALDCGSAVISRWADEPGASFRRRRERMGLSIWAVAERVAMAPEDVAEIEEDCAKRRFSIHVLARIAQALDIDPCRLSWERFE